MKARNIKLLKQKAQRIYIGILLSQLTKFIMIMTNKNYKKMKNVDKEFIMDLFLDSENVCTVNRLVVSIANVINENHDNLNTLGDLMKREYNQVSQSVSDECLLGVSIRRVKCFYELVIQNFTDIEYVNKFKMKRSTVEALITFMKSYIKPGNIPLDKKVHVFLWFLLNDSSYNDIGKMFGLHKSSVSYIFNEIASLLTENRYHFISWPSSEEQHITRIKVTSRFKFPQLVGFIDACRFKVGPQRNRKEKPEMVLLQAVCDESLMFMDIYIGEKGKLRKNRVFKESPLSHELKNFVDFDNHILGDSDYRLKMNVITPFTSEELLTSEEMKFNEVHWKARSYIGRAFELLKERFRKLNHIDVVKMESVNYLISAACVLHNFILMQEGCSDVKEEIVLCDDGVSINTDIVKTAEEKRQFLCNYINYMDLEE
ncbi:LOW QUALITY PROTEIN: protein ALP1-like [Manduca sexta]|uniref:LOW QUALITY PROTEIN: protein ALP1-like n=1 Tax=Manduca sexta TaxID=7130 RepID=UPI00188F111C|nr:LOW QUALITY PROTEIN: protein ALP1-like [Manduca sexta]